MTEVVPNQAYDAWNVKSLLFIPVFLFSEDYVRKGVLHDLKEIRSEERIAFGNSLSEKRRESGLSQEELGQIIGEYSCVMKSHFRKFGNQMSGSGNHLCNYASLLA